MSKTARAISHCHPSSSRRSTRTKLYRGTYTHCPKQEEANMLGYVVADLIPGRPAGPMEEDGKLPVTVVETTVAAAPPLSAVRLVSEWALVTAFCIAFVPSLLAFILYYFHVHCDRSSIVLRCVDLTDAAAAENATLWDGMLCCAGIQAAAAALALLLPSRRRRIRVRHGLAFVALAAAILGHCMYAAGVRIVLAADPGFLFYRISCTFAIVVLAVGDTVAFVTLLLAGPGGED